MERVCAGLPGAAVERREGYLAVSLELPAELAAVSEQAGALLTAFPVRDGRRTVRVDVRNRHWAALVIELADAARRGAAHGDA